MLAHLGQVYTTSVFLFSPSFLCFSPAEAEIFPPFSLASFYRGVVRTLFFLNQFAEAPSPPLSQPRLGGALRAFRRPPQPARPPMLVARRAEVALIKGRCVACGLASPARRCQGLVYLGKNRLEMQFVQSHELSGAEGSGGDSRRERRPRHPSPLEGTGSVPARRGERCPPAPLISPAPRPGLAAPALMRSIKRIIDVEVRCEVPAGGKRGSAADTGALICTTWLKPESRHFINGFSLC